MIILEMGTGSIRAAEVLGMRQHRAFIKSMCGECQCILKMQRTRGRQGVVCVLGMKNQQTEGYGQPLMDPMSSAYEVTMLFDSLLITEWNLLSAGEQTL